MVSSGTRRRADMVRRMVWGLLVSAGLAATGRGEAPTTQPAGTPPLPPASAPADRGPRLAVQLYIWLQDRASTGSSLWDDLDAVLGEVRAAGFEAFEGWLDFFADDERAARTAELVRKHGLTIAGLYHGGLFHEPDGARQTAARILEMARRARRLGPCFINTNPDPLPGAALKSDEQLAVQVEALNALAGELAGLDMPLLIHHHDAEMKADAREFRYLLRHLDPAVGLCLDLHWVHRGGLDPLTLLREARPRVRALHLRNSLEGVWTETFEPGEVDYTPIADYLRESGYRGWLVLELARMPGTPQTRSLVENHRLGREYLERLFLGRPAAAPTTP